MKQLSRHWRNIPSAIRKPLVLIVGVAIVLVGLALLVLPGPGWAAIFLGFAVLATEFTIAKKVRDWLVAKLKALLETIRKKFKRAQRRQ